MTDKYNVEQLEKRVDELRNEVNELKMMIMELKKDALLEQNIADKSIPNVAINANPESPKKVMKEEPPKSID
jgi:cell division septum initiation protein DivIVA